MRTAGRYTVSVGASFSATHRLRLSDGRFEPMHGHDWRVRAYFSAPQLDATGMVVDFHDAEAALQGVMSQLHHRHLNDHADVQGVNPTAEAMARMIFEKLSAAGWSSLRRVRVTESPGCWAAYGVR